MNTSRPLELMRNRRRIGETIRGWNEIRRPRGALEPHNDGFADNNPESFIPHDDEIRNLGSGRGREEERYPAYRRYYTLAELRRITAGRVPRDGRIRDACRSFKGPRYSYPLSLHSPAYTYIVLAHLRAWPRASLVSRVHRAPEIYIGKTLREMDLAFIRGQGDDLTRASPTMWV